MGAVEVLLASETLTPSCRDAVELADHIGVLVSQVAGTAVKIKSMRLRMENDNGEDITINWKRGK